MKKILVIESNKELLENITEILELRKYEVIVATNGKLAVQEALRNKPDVILCEIMVPGIDGYGVLHILHNRYELQQTPFIFLTTKSERSEMRKAMSFGADDYLIKPFDTADLLGSVERQLKKADTAKEKAFKTVEASTKPVYVGEEEALKILTAGRHIDRYEKGQRIFAENNLPQGIFFLQKGKVKVFKTNDTGKELILKIACEGDFFGYIALLENSVYRHNAEALEDCEVIEVPKFEFDQLIHTNPNVSAKFMKLLARDVSQKGDRLINMAYNSLKKKVAEAILQLKDKFRDQPGKYSIHISRENFAALAGTATESLIRTLTEFKSAKLIDIKDAKVTVLNEEKLKKIMNWECVIYFFTQAIYEASDYVIGNAIL